MTTLYEKQQTEIATIKDRTIVLKLSDADVKRVYEKACNVGLTVPELLQNFIGDLVDGTYSNGSDEREYAQQWLERCWFFTCVQPSFLRYLVQNCDLDRFVSEWNEIEELREELKCAVEHPDEYEQEDIAAVEEQIKYCSDYINDDFASFTSYNKCMEGITLESEMENVLEWHTQMTKAML